MQISKGKNMGAAERVMQDVFDVIVGTLIRIQGIIPGSTTVAYVAGAASTNLPTFWLKV